MGSRHRSEDDDEVGDAFAETACELLKEFIHRLERTQAEVVRLLELRYKQSSVIEPMPEYSFGFLIERLSGIRDDFSKSRHTFHILQSQASQWMIHGDTSPHRRLELEVRLSHFEHLIDSTEELFTRHGLDDGLISRRIKP